MSNAKLSPEDIHDIVTSTETGAAMAKKYKVCLSTIKIHRKRAEYKIKKKKKKISESEKAAAISSWLSGAR